MKILKTKMTVYKSFIVSLALVTPLANIACNASTEVNSSTVIEAPKKLEPLTIEKIDQTPDSAIIMLMIEHISQCLPANADQELAYILSLSNC